jgi:hypothetical protein
MSGRSRSWRLAFNRDRKGFIPADLLAERRSVGRHYLLLTGYDDARQVFTRQIHSAGQTRPYLPDSPDHRRAFNYVYIIIQDRTGK